MPRYSCLAPWLNGRPIDAPKKIDMINWYLQTSGCFGEPTEDDSRNSVIRNLRLHGNILCNDEFHAENTANDNSTSTYGRVGRVFRAIDMVRKYKAACEDGADLSISIVRDFAIVWNDNKGDELQRDLMQNYRQVCEEIRSPENQPTKAFWVAQEIQRSTWNRNCAYSFHIDSQEASTVDVSSLSPGKLNPTTPEFVPKSTVKLTLFIQEVPGTARVNSSGQQNLEDREDEYWAGDESFIPTFCSNQPGQAWGC